jgi:lysophospholipid acyltransferase (LPLAT)-like uncharacterized protein
MTAMKLRNPHLLRWAGFLTAGVIRAWHSTIRHMQHSVDGSQHPADPRRRRCIYAIWHDSIPSILYLRTRIDALISHHSDGELITQTCRFLNVGVVRGSSTRGGSAALMKMIESARDRHLLVTPDGPRGPRHVIRPGLAYLSSLTGLPIVLIAVGYQRAWRLNTWDRLALPRPWSTTCGILSEPIYAPADLRPEELTDYCGRIERRFIQLTAAAERWAETGQRPGGDELRPVDFAVTLPKCAA